MADDFKMASDCHGNGSHGYDSGIESHDATPLEEKPDNFEFIETSEINELNFEDSEKPDQDFEEDKIGATEIRRRNVKQVRCQKGSLPETSSDKNENQKNVKTPLLPIWQPSWKNMDARTTIHFLIVTVLFISHLMSVWISLQPYVNDIQEDVITQDNLFLPKSLSSKWKKLEMRLKAEAGEEGVKTVDEISQEELSRSPYAFEDIYDDTWPLLIRGLAGAWPAMNWTKAQLAEEFGTELVMVRRMEDGEASGSIETIDWFVTESLSLDADRQWIYIEDEHFLRSHPGLGEHIPGHFLQLHPGDGSQRTNPDAIGTNFFDLFREEIRPWDKMLLWGSPRSRSPLHVDPYNWTGVATVLRGHKKWKLVLPGNESLLKVKQGQRCNFPLDCVKYNSDLDLFGQSGDDFPREAVIEVDQHPGDVLLIPSGWFHQAYNEQETLAISSQVMNVHNFREVIQEILRGNKKAVETAAYEAADVALSRSGGGNENNKRLAHFIDEFMRRLPAEVIENGERVTKQVEEQFKEKRTQLRKRWFLPF